MVIPKYTSNLKCATMLNTFGYYNTLKQMSFNERNVIHFRIRSGHT